MTIFYHIKVIYKLWPQLQQVSLSFQVRSCVLFLCFNWWPTLGSTTQQRRAIEWGLFLNLKTHFEERTFKIRCFHLRYSFTFEAKAHRSEPSLSKVWVHRHRDEIWPLTLLLVKNPGYPLLIGDEDVARNFFHTAHIDKKSSIFKYYLPCLHWSELHGPCRPVCSQKRQWCYSWNIVES